MDAPSVKGSQRKWLRGKAHALSPLIHVGKDGVTEGVIAATNEALHAHELIKVRLHEPEEKKALAQELADGTGSDLVGLIGHVVILYKPHPEKPRLKLPD